ncbi:MAG TPA: GerMN domain-containing protein [Rectinemataceae bacterium]|nr:GerMN domain-containing protein [Rectinemataceae bacterium]
MAARGKSSGRGGGRSTGGAGRDSASAGCLLWLIVFSSIFLLFVLNWGRIKATLDRTNFNEIVKNQRVTEKPAPEAPSAPAAQTPEAGNQGRGGTTTPVQPPPASPAPGGVATNGGGQSAGDQGGARSPDATGTQSPGASAVSGAEKALDAAQLPKGRPATLYFVRIDDDGVIVRQNVRRMIAASDTPLKDALDALIAGPDDQELGQHLVSLIPSGTKLLGVRVQGTTAVINLSEPFMYNHYGIEGYAGQLKQIVYTATAFPTVHDVQILIDGERHDYLGGEGVYIGKPLSRNSF